MFRRTLSGFAGQSITGPLVIASTVKDIYFNLAVETYLAKCLRPASPLLFWWRNAQTVVIGRHQNPWRECNVLAMNVDGVKLARRFSGGGSVYQDLGNSCFTLIVPETLFGKDKAASIVLNTLRKNFGICGQSTGRNDMEIDGKKFSGTAYQHIRDVHDPSRSLCVHHGTLLIDVDFNNLTKYLTPSPLKLQAKGIESVVTRVGNLKDVHADISHDRLLEPLAEEFHSQFGSHGGAPLIIDDSSEITAREEFRQLRAQLEDWSWQFGTTPEFSHRFEKRFEWGTVEVNLKISEGAIKDVDIFTDALDVESVPIWRTVLLGAAYNRDKVLGRFTSTSPHMNEITREFSQWIGAEIAS